jgi:hypothetical protein
MKVRHCNELLEFLPICYLLVLGFKQDGGLAKLYKRVLRGPL